MSHNDEIIISLVELIERLVDSGDTRLVKRFSPRSAGRRLLYLELTTGAVDEPVDEPVSQAPITETVQRELLCFPALKTTLPPGYQEFKAGVDKWRAGNGLTQSQLASKLGTNHSQLSSLLRGKLSITKSNDDLRSKVEQVTGVKLSIKTKIKTSHVIFKAEMDQWVKDNSTTYKILAKEIGVSKTLLTDLVLGKGNPTDRRLRAMEDLQQITGVAFYKDVPL